MELSSTEIKCDINDLTWKQKESIQEKNELQNSRLERIITLRKRRLNDYLTEKRKKYINQTTDNDIYINIDYILKNIPPLLLADFDLYEDKLSVIHDFLSNNFTLLHGMDFNPDNVKLFIIYKLNEYTYENNDELLNKKNEEKLNVVFYDIIKIMNETKNIKVLYCVTTILLNILYDSKVLCTQFMKINNIWKRLQDISEIKNPDLNDNIIMILFNIYSNNPGVGKEYIISNYSIYIKQILINFLKLFDNEIKKNNIELELFMNGITLFKKLINNENKDNNKNNNFDVIVEMKGFYKDLSKIFSTLISWLLSEIKITNDNNIFRFILNLLECFNAIIGNADEETYDMNEFLDNDFVSSFFNLIKMIILNKNKELENGIILDILVEIYNFLSLIFSLESKKSEIYSQNKIIILTEELIKKIGLKNKKLFCKILFFLSNYVDKEERCVEIFKNNFLLTNIIENTYNNITDESMSNHLYYLLDNGFLFSDSNCKEIIINNFTSFLIERIKILCEYVIKDQNISRFNKTCQLLSYFIVFLEIEPEKYAEILKYLIIFIQKSNLEVFLMNIQTNAKNYDQNIITELLSRIKS
jgi:hypothetical protein